MSMFRRLISLTVATALTAASTAWADDIEIYQSNAAAKGAQPNVLFIIDSSISMNTTVKLDRAPYDPSKTYTGSCDSNRIYFSSGTTPPTCSSQNYISVSNNTCSASFEALKNGGVGLWPAFNETQRILQYRSSSWQKLAQNDAGMIECMADEGIHGKTDGAAEKYLYGGTKNGVALPQWASTSKSRWSDGSVPTNTYRLYSANYLNYRESTPDPVDLTRMQIVQGVAKALASTLTGVNLGLMRYGPPSFGGSDGGYVLSPVQDIATSRSTIIDQINNLPTENYTPLSETLWEAALYYQGGTPKYGTTYSAATSKSGGTYISPMKYTCQKNFIVYLTDGSPTKDHGANADIAGQTKTTLAKDGSCPEKVHPHEDSGYETGDGSCMDELTGYLADRDDKGVSMDVDLSDKLDGKQTVQTYMIGFGDSIKDSEDYLDEIAARGGTKQSYKATDPDSLTTTLQSIFGDIRQDSGTFVTPSVAVNAFNRAQTSDELYFSLFKVGSTPHWSGNLKKYKLLRSTTSDPPQIVDANGKPAVNSKGFFADDTQSYWSVTPDKGNVELGGAISQQVAPDLRPLYTSTGGSTIVDDKNALKSTVMTDALMGTGASTSSCNTTCVASLAWLRGYNIDVNDDTKVLTTTRQYMGDPLHGRPAVVPYDETNTVVYVPTNDGLLHAINAADGKELWAYMPPELLSRVQTLRKGAAGAHTYGLDGDIRVLRMDKNQNGKVDSGDRVWLFFGMRAGGNHYYGIDVTNRTAPALLWNIGPTQLPNVGQTWSPPVVTRVNVGGSTQTDAEKFVLIFGGGYDTGQEAQEYSTDTVGNRVYMVEAKTGKLLWSAGGPGGTPAPNLVLKHDADGNGYEMNNSIPAPIRVIDTNGDGFADRLYAADTGGRIWRFDIFNGKDPASTTEPLVTGGIFAALGAGDVSTADSKEDARRFYNAPDVSLISIRGTAPFFNVAIGSGYRGHPLDDQTVEKFYSVRDMNPYTPMTQDEYSKAKPVLDTELKDITADPTGTEVVSSDKGWVLKMTHGKGEKVMSESTTVNNVILFTSFEPTSLAGSGDCFPTAVNRVYALTAFGGKPAINFYDADQSDGKEKLTNEDISTKLAEENTIVGDVAVAVLRDDNSSISPPTVCLAGMEVLKKCVNVGGTIRTFWNRGDAK
jgi:type IV pilus assembly protein PilY1